MRHKLKVDVGGTRVAVRVWGPDDTAQYGIKNWSLAPLQRQEDADNGEKRLAVAIAAAAGKMGVHNVLAPPVAHFSAKIVDKDALKRRIKLVKNVILYRDHSPADGIFVPPGYAFAMSGAGCPVIIATGGKYMIVAHAGRNSLIDSGAVNGKPSRRHVSVVNSIVEEFARHLVTPNEIAMTMCLAIPANMFEHQLNIEYNRKLLGFIYLRWSNAVYKDDNGSFYLSLETLFEQQALHAHVKDVCIANSLSEFPALAHTRDGKGRERRNLIVVKRCS